MCHKWKPVLLPILGCSRAWFNSLKLLQLFLDGLSLSLALSLSLSLAITGMFCEILDRIHNSHNSRHQSASFAERTFWFRCQVCNVYIPINFNLKQVNSVKPKKKHFKSNLFVCCMCTHRCSITLFNCSFEVCNSITIFLWYGRLVHILGPMILKTFRPKHSLILVWNWLKKSVSKPGTH